MIVLLMDYLWGSYLGTILQDHKGVLFLFALIFFNLVSYVSCDVFKPVFIFQK